MSRQQVIEQRIDQIEGEMQQIMRELIPMAETMKELSDRYAKLQMERQRLCFDRVLAFMGGDPTRP